MPSSNFKPQNEDEELDEKRIYRTTYIFSATMSTVDDRLARKYLRNLVVVIIRTAGKTTDLTQHLIIVKESEKMTWLQNLLDDLGDKTAIVFINIKKIVDFVYKTLEKAGYRVTSLHGRGIDIPDVAHVMDYDMPRNIILTV
ncbi:DEAD-box ATP-dependent RNA helicase 21 [Tanacetum coccineum]